MLCCLKMPFLRAVGRRKGYLWGRAGNRLTNNKAVQRPSWAQGPHCYLGFQDASLETRLAQLLRHQAPEDRTESKVRQLAEARLSPKLPCNPRPTLPVTGLPWQHLPVSLALSGLSILTMSWMWRPAPRQGDTAPTRAHRPSYSYLRPRTGCLSPVTLQSPGVAFG